MDTKGDGGQGECCPIDSEEAQRQPWAVTCVRYRYLAVESMRLRQCRGAAHRRVSTRAFPEPLFGGGG